MSAQNGEISGQLLELKAAPLGERIQEAQDFAKVISAATRVFYSEVGGVGMSDVSRRKITIEFVYAYTLASASPYLVDAAGVAREVVARTLGAPRRGR